MTVFLLEVYCLILVPTVLNNFISVHSAS